MYETVTLSLLQLPATYWVKRKTCQQQKHTFDQKPNNNFDLKKLYIKSICTNFELETLPFWQVIGPLEKAEFIKKLGRWKFHFRSIAWMKNPCSHGFPTCQFWDFGALMNLIHIPYVWIQIYIYIYGIFRDSRDCLGIFTYIYHLIYLDGINVGIHKRPFRILRVGRNERNTGEQFSP